MSGFITRDECGLVVDALDNALRELPPNAAALRAKLRTTRNEHVRALKMFDRALADHGDDCGAEIRALGSLEAGETVQLARLYRVRRTSENGLCVFDNGKETWTNFSGKTTPLVILRNVEVDN